MADTRYTRTDSAIVTSSDKRSPTPNRPISVTDVEPVEWREGVRFGGTQIALARLGGARDIGVNFVTLSPGRQNCPFHWHMREEEHFYILEGQCVLRSGAERFEMKAGDYVCFPAGTFVGHCFENPYEQPCRLLAIGSRDDAEIAGYPDSGKMKLRGLGVIVPLTKHSLDYWHGERAEEPLGASGGAAEREHDTCE